jgi:hypothetical protein
MKTLFLHVGPHKTGTTAIQKYMLDNQVEFHKQGVLYPKRFVRIFGHHHIRERLAEKNFSAEDIDFFKNTDANFVISSEDLISLSKDNFTYLKQSLPFLTVKVVFSWRRASLKLYSIWQEVIKHGGTIDFFAYYHEHLARPAMSQMLSPDLKLGMFGHVFGKQNLIVIDYDASAKNNTLIPDFLKAVGLSVPSNIAENEQDSNVRNASMSIEDIETVRALNYIFKSRSQSQEAADDGATRSAYQAHKEQLQGEDLSYLHAAIAKHHVAMNVGNYAIDIRAEKIMSKDYIDNIMNYAPNVGFKSVQLPSTEWLLDPQAHACLERIADKLLTLK